MDEMKYRSDTNNFIVKQFEANLKQIAELNEKLKKERIKLLLMCIIFSITVIAVSFIPCNVQF